MVFESVVTDVLNRVLGDYVENLDSKQLKIGIWGGDVVLTDLVLKPSALDDLDLPVQTVYGRLAKLVLKIPWKNLYGAAVEASIEGLYLLVVPNQQVIYDQEKEEKKEVKTKQDELQRIEDAKKKEAEKDKPKADDTFVEKLTTQIIKNVQVKITNIHIRYEDKVTHANHPFAMGVTLSNLSLETTDDTWKPTIVQEMTTKIFKVVSLEGLAVYWNCNSVLYANLPIVDLLHHLNTEIASKSANPANYNYLLGPINSSARLRLNPKPDCDVPEFSVPKVHLNLEMEKLFIGISKTQYQDVIALADSMDVMSRGMPFRQFRPHVNGYKGHYKEWWHFAYVCVLEDVRRKRRNWDWKHMMEHRNICKDYATVYQAKLTQKKIAQDVQTRLDLYEKKLDIFNIVIIRQKIEMEMARLGKLQSQVQQKSWFSSWWGSAADEDKELQESTDIVKKFEAAMTPDEKSRLYKAIDYQENSAPVEFPEAYVDNSCTFVLRLLEIQVRDDLSPVPRVVSTELTGVKCRLDTRAAASAIKVAVNIDEFSVLGQDQDDVIPELVTSKIQTEEAGALLDVLFETNPLDKTCAQRIHVSAKPLKVIYDAQTINKVVDVFRTPESSALEQLSAAAENSLNNFKEMSATGLQHAIQKRTILDLKVDLRAPYVVVPYGGRYTGIENVLVVNLGHVKISSANRTAEESVDIRLMHQQGTTGKLILEEMIARSYDKFILEFTDLQVVLAQGGEDWSLCLKETCVTPLHLLSPVNLNITFYKCVISDDPRLPLTKIRGQLPSVAVNITDVRLLLLVALATSIPLPEESPPENKPLLKSSRSRSSSQSMMLKYMELPDKPKPKKASIVEEIKDHKGDFVQFTTLDVQFVMKELSVMISHQEMSASPSEDVASFKINSLELDLVQQTYNTAVTVRLAGIACSQYRANDSIDIISTPLKGDAGDYLFIVKFMQVDKKSPEFHSKHQSCESRLNLEFASLNVILHQEGLQSLMKFATELQMQVEELRHSSTTGVNAVPSSSSVERIRRMSSVAENFVIGVKSSRAVAGLMPDKKTPKKIVIETIQFKVNAHLQELMVMFACDKQKIASCAIKGINAEVIMKKSYTQVVARLLDLTVVDLNPKSIHSKILTVSSEEAVNAQVVMYTEEHKLSDANSVDMSVQATMGCLRIVFLNWFVTNMLDFLNQFQTAQAAIIEASQAAAQTAKQNVQNAYENATRISLNIDLKAPDIIVPTSSQSYDALLLDLGHITISNRFLTLDIQNEQNQHPIIDELKLKLTNFTLARIKLDHESNTISKRPLLEPVTFSLSVKRNLSTGWYKAVPDIDLSGKIDSITLLLSQMDFQMVMSVLSGNLAEGQQQPAPAAVTSKTEIHAAVTAKQTGADLAAGGTASVTDKSLISGEQPMVYTSVKFTFTMDSFIINLFTGGSKTLSNLSPAHDPKDALARFCLEVLSVKGRILSDSSIATSVLLVNCSMDDMRKSRENKLTRLIERKQDAPEADIPAHSTSSESVCPTRSMLDVTFQQKENDMFADVRVCGFTLILSVDYLLKIAEFFTGAMAEEGADVKKAKSRSQVQLKEAGSSRATIKSAAATVAEKETTMTLNLRVEKPDIILVEHMDNIDTNALVLNAEILMKLRTSGAHQVISGSISDIQLYTCCYDPARRAETRGPVLHPVSISIAGSTPQGQGLHIEVCITDVRISVSPSTIELLNRVYSTMYSGDAARVDSDVSLEDRTNIWEYKSYSEQDFWFLKAETAEDAFEVIGDLEEPSALSLTPKVKELCIVALPSLIITLEAGVGNKTLPMLLLESSFQGTVNDWSSQMTVDASLTLQIGYYNSRLALWEPLIEPVEIHNDNKITYVPWELKLEVSMNEQEEPSTSPSGEVEEEHIQIQPAMSIDISSKTNLELTVTKTGLEVLNNLGKAFSNAIAEGTVKTTDVSAPYKVKNDSGLQIALCLEKGAFKVYGQDGPVEVVLESGAEVNLQLKPSLEVASTSIHLDRVMSSSVFKVLDRFLHVKITDLMSCNLELPVVRADKRYFLLKHRGENNDSWGLVSVVAVEEGVLIITLRSIIQVHNHFSTPVDVYYMTARGNELECISSIEPGATVNIPVKAVYTPTNELFFSIPGYSVTSTPFIWKDLQLNLSVTKLMHCTPKDNENNNEPFVIKAVGETEQIYHENTTRHTMASTSYNIHLYPAVTLKNCLPVSIICCVQNIAEEKLVKPGEVLQMPNVDPGTSKIVIRLPDYLEKEWSCQHDIATNPPPFSVWQFDSYDSVTKVSLDLGMHALVKSGSMVMSLYCPFWMLNKTGLLIGYRKSKKTEKNEASGSPAKTSDENLNILHHPANFKGPVLFSFNAKNFFGKKKASVRVEQGEWSDKFSLDVAGSSGFVVCKANNMIYQIGVHNQLTYNGLTKQVTFTPYYVIINNAPFAIECQELDRPADTWTRVEENSCAALWPRSERDDKLLKLRVIGTDEISAPFLYTETHTTLLKLQNKFGGMNVDIQMTEGAVYINLTAYESGMAPALIINHTSDTLSLWEKETVQIRKLPPNHQALYTWENPSGPRVLVWDIGRKKELEDELRKDGVGEFSPQDNCHIYWVSFLDGMQRILLFTMDKEVAENVQSAKQLETIQQEITVFIHGLGLSLVNNYERQEVMYVGIASSGIIWESCKLHSTRFKQLSTKDSANMENAYQIYLTKQQVATMDFGRALIDNKTEVDFESGFMLKPHKRRIRRTFQTGLWLQMKTSPHQLQLHAKVNRLQIDNQMFDCVFPVVLAPVPPPKSVAGDSIQKPFAELSIVQRIIKYSQIRQFKYFKVLIQEFHIKVDLGFVNAVVDMLQSSEYSEQEEQEQFLKDVSLVDEPLLAHVSTQSLQEQKNFYDLLHFSPLKVHVSFSIATGSSVQGANTPNFLNVLLQGLGVTLTDMQDVVFRLAYFEREYTFLTQRQLISEATTHYVGQSVKQLYVLVLGLDVLGNPYGLVLGITKGVEDLFYEPFQGAIQGPGEFAEGLVLGVRSLFGHTVGGAAGAVSRITGAMGKGIAALTFDKDYQRKRRDQINKKPATVQEGIARGGKGLVMGVVDGVTGVFTKPISGAKEQGVEGFFKGLGKGAVGLVTRPTAGVIDFASGSLDAVKRATELGEEANRLRPPRFLQADGLVRPFNRGEADGHKLLTELEKGKYANTDIYTSHFIIIDKKDILMLTDKRLAYMTHNDIFGGWQVEWSYTWQELQNPPKIVSKGIAIIASEAKKKKLGFFGSSESGKIILVGDPGIQAEICGKIEELMKNA